ncbi:hypothetical protein [Nocardia aurea]|uniref:hypothetical protein n=1 Tax=Nocardia aurea TaxID=2144174 RepID=UPI0018E504E3|nr:hypothetical protein [Nocardia aurea]
MSASQESLGKVGREHTDRMAVVYVRQSTRRQVLEHTVSARVQYALAVAGGHGGAEAIDGIAATHDTCAAT